MAESPKSKFKKTLLITALVLVILIGVVVLIIKTLSSPAEGTISQTAQQNTAAKEIAGQPGKYSGKYASFTYPAKYEIVPSPKNDNPLDGLRLFSTDHTSKQISIRVVRESLGNDSGINHRRGHPETYTKKSETPTNIVFTSGKDGSEQTGYIQHNDLVISISITTTGQRDLSKDYDTIANSLEWK